MLVQRSEIAVPGHAWLRTAALRARGVAIQVLRSGGLATDWGLLAPLVGYIARQRRTQLSLVLDGDGYFERERGRFETLVPGSVVRSDQRRGAGEGYAGYPSTVACAFRRT